ncbi:MAG: anthranilate synthase component II [Mycobacteriaceae bacterium]|uniref:anthranilate synthase component II n=1 Tax=Corynebacterium sp. TaxID=1720 RepID=UPI003F9D7184
MRILVIDNYDSFVYNLVQYLGELGEDCTVWRNDAAELETSGDDLEGALEGFGAVLVSPGPGDPSSAGRTLDVIAHCAAHRIPMLGVCLGHQALAQHFGAAVVRADEIFHGKTSPVTHDGTGVLAGIPSPFTVARYHSLTVDPATVPDGLLVSGRVESGMIMAMRHAELPLHSVQFHPESIMTNYGHRILSNWLADAGRPVDEAELTRLAARHADTLAGATAAVGG